MAQLLENGSTQTGKAIFDEENKIDALKKKHLGEHVKRLQTKESHPLAGLGFVAFLNHVEKIGDHLTNITEAAVSQFAYDRGKTPGHPKA